MVCEGQFVLDVVLAALHGQEPLDERSPRKIRLPNLYCGIETSNLVTR
jgi:hypothetical protein